MEKEASDHGIGRVPAQETVHGKLSPRTMLDPGENPAKFNFFLQDIPKHAPPTNKSASTSIPALKEIQDGPKNGLQLIQGTKKVFFFTRQFDSVNI